MTILLIKRNNLGQACTTYDPQGKWGTAETFNLALKTENFVNFASLFDKNTL